ncbi:hypothetical protein V5O48_012202 [Marasmius crinis-equi]|uniref:Uncharacterized protein n=1 Tax=Marasmius crinis-equi TaxID=585013 RepID=A0ABR3F3F3_9AGAR
MSTTTTIADPFNGEETQLPPPSESVHNSPFQSSTSCSLSSSTTTPGAPPPQQQIEGRDFNPRRNGEVDFPMPDVFDAEGVVVRMPGMGDAERALKSKSLKTKKLNTACINALGHRADQEEAIGNKTGVRLPRVKKMLGTVQRIKNMKKPSPYNAALQAKAKEVNAGRAPGSKVSLKELHQLTKSNSELMKKVGNEAEAQKLVEETVAVRDDRMRGMRGSNKIAANDASKTLSNLNAEADDLSSRTGAVTFGVVCRGSYESTIEAGFYGRGPIADFLQAHFNVSIWDFVAMLEGYACQREKLGTKGLSADATKSHIAGLIQADLESITGHSPPMSYVNYEREIVHKYHVVIRGWPTATVPFRAPHNLNAAQARELHDLWKSGVCHWEKLSRKEQLDLKRRIEEEDANGQGPRPKKTRKDKGGVHQKQSGVGGGRRSRKVVSAPTVEDVGDEELEEEPENAVPLPSASCRPRPQPRRIVRKEAAPPSQALDEEEEEMEDVTVHAREEADGMEEDGIVE